MIGGLHHWSPQVQGCYRSSRIGILAIATRAIDAVFWKYPVCTRPYDPNTPPCSHVARLPAFANPSMSAAGVSQNRNVVWNGGLV